jgi:hypothetical protein
MEEIVVSPPRNLLATLLGFLAYFSFTGMAAMLPLALLVLAFYSFNSSPGRTPHWEAGVLLVLLVFSVASAFRLAFWLQRSVTNRCYWRLTEDELIGGRAGEMHFPLSSVEKIFIGLPTKSPIPGMDILVEPRALRALIAAKANSLLVVFRDGSMLPMRLHRLPNGTALMEELVIRLKDRVETNREYSAQEIRLLRFKDPNVLIRKK